MHNVANVKSSELFSVISELLEKNHKVRLAVTGSSMMPFLREDIDSVELAHVNFEELHFGQIPLIKRNNGQYILHRLIYKRKNSFFIAGDSQNWVEGPLYPEQIVAVVTQVWRNNKPISQNNLIWQAASFFWWLRLPIRYVFKKLYKLIRQLVKKDLVKK